MPLVHGEYAVRGDSVIPILFVQLCTICCGTPNLVINLSSLFTVSVVSTFLLRYTCLNQVNASTVTRKNQFHLLDGFSGPL